jgi:hypothetical protein
MLCMARSLTLTKGILPAFASFPVRLWHHSGGLRPLGKKIPLLPSGTPDAREPRGYEALPYGVLARCRDL